MAKSLRSNRTKRVRAERRATFGEVKVRSLGELVAGEHGAELLGRQASMAFCGQGMRAC